MTKVLVGMSGGVDSSVSAYLLKKDGYEVVGATMFLHSSLENEENKKMIHDAKSVAEKLGIEHHVLDFSKEFSQNIVGNFLSEYKNARTPNPCIICNEKMKFGVMLDAAQNLGCDKIATGHYARIIEENGRFFLKKSESAVKDQTYFLYRLNQHQLAHAIFPLEGLEKDTVRQIASELGLSVAEKKDSQEICFIPDDDYVAFLKEHGVTGTPGDFCLETGEVIGQHGGLERYTIGQRKGLGIAWAHPLYVKHLSVLENKVILCANDGLFTSYLTASDTSYIPFDSLQGEMEVVARVRYRTAGAKAIIRPLPGNRVECIFSEPQRAVTPGQSVVFYDGDTVIGGGFID